MRWAGISRPLVAGWERHADDMTFDVVPGASHWMLNETPDLLAREMSAFLGRRAPARL